MKCASKLKLLFLYEAPVPQLNSYITFVELLTNKVEV